MVSCLIVKVSLFDDKNTNLKKSKNKYSATSPLPIYFKQTGKISKKKNKPIRRFLFLTLFDSLKSLCGENHKIKIKFYLKSSKFIK